MKSLFAIWTLLLALCCRPLPSSSQLIAPAMQFDFYGEPIHLPYNRIAFIDFTDMPSLSSIQSFYDKTNSLHYKELVRTLLEYKDKYKLDDWLYYQLIRKTAQQISPKADNYYRYTLYKWLFLTSSGYDAILRISDDRLLFYIRSDENVYNIPSLMKDNKQYVCLNYHDYGAIDFEKNRFSEIPINIPGSQNGFSYKVRQLPNFRPSEYLEKDIRFNYNQNNYYFRVKLNPQIKTLFANYPVVDYESYFNIPLSNETYQSLMPLLRKSVKGMTTRNGVDFLMKFTRYAFLFEPDSESFGNEKRLSPEQTLLYDKSDCEDRAALFFYLVREIYNLPMIVLAYPKHVTIAIKFDKPVGTPIVYNGSKYSLCEPTPQKRDLQIGEIPFELRQLKYEIAFVYDPAK